MTKPDVRQPGQESVEDVFREVPGGFSGQAAVSSHAERDVRWPLPRGVKGGGVRPESFGIDVRRSERDHYLGTQPAA